MKGRSRLHQVKWIFPSGILAFFLAIGLVISVVVRASADPDFSRAAGKGNVLPVAASSALSPAELLTRAIERCEKLEAYQCRLKLHLTKAGRVQDSEYVFSYKKPNLIRMHVASGNDGGSTVILRGDGVIRARREGLLSMLAITLKPDDQRLSDLWNRSFSDSDWVTLLSETKDRLKQVAATDVESMDGGRKILLKSRGKDFTEQTVLDIRQLVLLKKQAWLDNGDTLEAVWSDIDLNPAFDDAFFQF